MTKQSMELAMFINGAPDKSLIRNKNREGTEGLSLAVPSLVSNLLPGKEAVDKYQVAGKVTDPFTEIFIIFLISQGITPGGSPALGFQIPGKLVEFDDQGVMAGGPAGILVHFFLFTPQKPVGPEYHVPGCGGNQFLKQFQGIRIISNFLYYVIVEGGHFFQGKAHGHRKVIIIG